MTVANNLRYPVDQVGNDNVISLASFQQAWRIVRQRPDGTRDYTLMVSRIFTNLRPDPVERDYSYLDEWDVEA